MMLNYRRLLFLRAFSFKGPIRSVSLSLKLALGFLLVLLIFSAVAIFNHFRMEQIEAKHTYERKQAERQQHAMDLKSLVQELDSYANGYMVSNNYIQIEQYDGVSPNLEILVKEVAGTASNSDQREWGARLTAISKEFVANFEKVKKIAGNAEISPEEKQSMLTAAYSASQLHKQTIFDLVQWFYEDYTLEAETAKEETSRMLSVTQWVTSIAAAAAFVIGAAVAAAILVSFSKGVRNIGRAVQWMNEGDLRYAINAKAKDELGRLSDSFDASMIRMKEMLTQTKGIAESLREHSLHFMDFARNTAETNGSIVLAMEEMADGASKQAVQAERSAAVILDLEEKMESIESSANVLLQTGAEANNYAKAGGNLVIQLEEASRTTADSLENMKQALNELEAGSAEITVITGTIADISKRTNILALNASIESARAGVQGKGFAVIAEEVRQLSVQSNQSSKRIDDILTDLRRQIADVANLMSATMDSVMKQNGKVEEAHAAFLAIFNVISAFGDQVRRIHEQVTVTKEKQADLAESVQIVASIAQQTAAGVEETAASASEQNQSVNKVASEAQDINALSEAIFAEINKFRIDG